MSNFFVNIPDASGSDAAGDLLFPSHGSIGVVTGQTSGTDERSSMIFNQAGIITGNVFGLNPPYGYNNPALAAGLFMAGGNTNSAAFMGSTTLFNSVPLAFVGFPKNAALSIMPAFNAADDSSTDVYFSLMPRSSAKTDLLLFGGDGNFSLLGGSVLFNADGVGYIGSPEGTTLKRPHAVYVKALLDIGSDTIDSLDFPQTFNLGAVQLTYDINSPSIFNIFTTNGDAIGNGGGSVNVHGGLFVSSNCNFGGATSVFNDNNTGVPDNSAVLALQSTARGFLPPCMTTTQKNAITPTEGLVVYDLILHALCVYDGTVWRTVTAV